MGAVLKMATNQREDDNVTILCRKFQAHVEMILEKFIVKTKKIPELKKSQKR